MLVALQGKRTKLDQFASQWVVNMIPFIDASSKYQLIQVSLSLSLSLSSPSRTSNRLKWLQFLGY